MHALDRIDRRILELLQAEGRISNAELAERVHLSPSACLRRVRQLEESGLIEGYRALLRPEALGRGGTVFVEISLTHQSEEMLNAFEQAVVDLPEVMECYLMAGDADYMLRVITADASDYERIHRTQLTRLPGVARIRTLFTLRTVTRRTAIPLPETK